MATTCFAMWLLQYDLAATHHLIMIFIGLIAVALAIMAFVMMAIAVKALKALKELSETADEMKSKVLPLLDEMMEVSRTGRILLQDAAPKVKVITDNLVKTSDTLVEASRVARSAVQQIDTTVTDANLRARRQISRVDGMVTVALTTTAEVAETINNGIRVPAQKIAVMATQAKLIAEGLLAKIKSMVANSPLAGRRDA